MVKIVIIMLGALYGSLADDVGEFNIVSGLHTEHGIMFIQAPTTQPAAVTYQIRFMKLAPNVTLTKTSRNIVKHSVKLINKQ